MNRDPDPPPRSASDSDPASDARAGGRFGRTAQGVASDVIDSLEVTPGAHEPLADLAREAGARLHDASRARRRWVAWAMLVVAIVFGASGTSALSASQGFTRIGPVAIVVLCYAVCFIALTRALRVIPVSIAYAVWSGIGIALVSVIGWVLFDQQLNRGELLGIGLILAGAVVIQLFSNSTHTR